MNTSIASTDGDDTNKATAAKSNNKDSTTQSREIASAIASGLLVDVSTPSPKKASRISNDKDMGGSPFSVLSESSPARNMLEDVTAEAAGTGSLRWGDDDSDSDDDLL